jgi:hypothetical protein
MKKTAGGRPMDDEELSDYRILLGCIRKRLKTRGLADAVESLERLDHAILEAILEREMAVRTVN